MPRQQEQSHVIKDRYRAAPLLLTDTDAAASAAAGCLLPPPTCSGGGGGQRETEERQYTHVSRADAPRHNNRVNVSVFSLKPCRLPRPWSRTMHQDQQPNHPASSVGDEVPHQKTDNEDFVSKHSVRRQHGFQPPLHPLQLTGWLALAALTGGSFIALVPALPPHVQPAALATLTALLLVHLASHLGTALVDPAEPELRERRSLDVPQLDRTKHQHVIESGRCHLCDIVTSSQRTKHCGACNKCVAGFDHHCKWLNQCVGSRNYAAFLMCVSSAVAAAAVVAALAVAHLVMYQGWSGGESGNGSDGGSGASGGGSDAVSHHRAQDDDDKKDPLSADSNSTSSHFFTPSSSLPSSDAAFLAVVAALGLLAAITAGLLLHLCFFHIYISFLGLTTYEYIRQQRQSQVPVAEAPASEEQGETSSKSRNSILRHRPLNLKCSDEERTRMTTLFSCSIMEETFSMCNNIEPTPTPPSTPQQQQQQQDCQMCVMANNSVAPEIKVMGQMHQQHERKQQMKKRWNCCVSVPDSPDDPHSPTEPRCLMSLCRHKAKSKGLPALEGRPHRTHGHWSSAKLRMIFRVLGNLGQNKRRASQSQVPRNNQVVPNMHQQSGHSMHQDPLIQTVNNLVPVPCYPEVASSRNNNSTRNAVTLPALPMPSRRRLISETELANALSVLQLQQQHQRCSVARRPSSYRRRRRSVVHRPKTPALSPIRESGLSNPASPSRQNCTVSAISGVCTGPV